MNVIKSLCMLFGSCQKTGGLNLTITLDGVIFKQVCSTKYLGVYLDQYISLGKLMRTMFLVELEGNFLL